MLLLMTWVDGPDQAAVVRASGRHVSTANAFVVANADEQWFHEPDVPPWLASGARAPLSGDLIAGYDAEVATRAPRRQAATERANAEAQAPLSNGPLSILMP
jgi:hypothetical protein